MPKLTDTQLVILSAASQRKDGALLPFPKSLKLNKGALTSVLNSLLKQGLISERPAALNEAHWREDNDQKFTLVVTEKRAERIGAEPEEALASKRAPAKAEVKKAKSKVLTTKAKENPASEGVTAAKGTKQALLIDLLTRKTGATIDEVIKATGWQAHSIRGAISGTLKKKLGLAVESKAVEGRGRVYQIPGGR